MVVNDILLRRLVCHHSTYNQDLNSTTPLRAQFNEVAYRQNLKTLSSTAIEQALFRPPDKPPPRALATLTLRQDVLAIKELLSRANLPEKGRGRITARQEFARKRQ
jgi:hypothetical protein